MPRTDPANGGVPIDADPTSPRVVILGAGEPHRGRAPSAVQATLADRRVLDWILDAFRELPDPAVHFVGGFGVDEVVEAYPDISVSVNLRWQVTGSTGSLLQAPLEDDRPTFVSYADVLYTTSAVQALEEANGDVVLAVDRGFEDRFPGRTQADILSAETVELEDDGAVRGVGTARKPRRADAEFAGLARLSPAALSAVRDLADERGEAVERWALPELFEALRQRGLEVRAVDVGDQWAELNAPQDLAQFVLGTKAETLERLRPMVTRSTIEDQVRFTVDDWRSDRARVLDEMQATFDQPVIVRSSALDEDTWQASAAGRFESVLDVDPGDADALSDAIETVVDSFEASDLDGPDEAGPAGEHQVLVQPMLDDVATSGVVFTRTLDHAAPYYVITYDDETGSTTSVTAGEADLATAYVHHEALWEADGFDADLLRVIWAVRELEELTGHDTLDVEFALTPPEDPDDDPTVHVLQLRPLPTRTGDGETRAIPDEAIRGALARAATSFQEAQAPTPPVLGEQTLFGVMPDWNPAEMIGTSPKRLALSLYRYLITDEVWATQRAEMGYRDVRPARLLATLGGVPYVDVRADFNSFVPASLDDALAERLVEHYLDKLEAQPHLHDKVEFDIVPTCLSLAFDERTRPELLEAGFTREETDALEDGLREVTENAIHRYEDDLAAVDRLGSRYEDLLDADLDPLARARALLEDAKRFGTLPFAHLARCAFVAVTLLDSLEEDGAITSEEAQAFLASVHTVPETLEADAARVRGGSLELEALVDRYGHLRPGTYEITSPRYADDPDRFLAPMVETATGPQHTDASAWDEDTRSRIVKALGRLGLSADADALEAFLRAAIEGREHAKFVFTRNVSRALEEIARFGVEHGLSRDEMAHVSVYDLLELSQSPPPGEVGEWLAERARQGREAHAITRALELPPLVAHEEQLFRFHVPDTEANYVTTREVTAEVARIDEGSDAGAPDVEGRIVLVTRADPGYDWLFAHDIEGLVTAYGGANSHMAIRAAELGLPAAIGVGETELERYAQARVLTLDPGNRRIRVER